jgi:two-component system invasion response regulator UvrY
MDINMPGMNGIQATKEILRISPKTKIVGISLHNQPAYAKKMMREGALGYITKNSTRQEMIHGLKEVAQGKKYICDEIKNILSEEMLNGTGERKIDELSEREKEVVTKLIQGASSKEIGKDLLISSKTVEVHRYNILKKLHFRNVAELVNYFTTHPF